MKKETSGLRAFLTTLLVFVAPLAAMGVAVEWGLSRVGNDMTTKRRLLESAAPGIETLVSGTSHAFYGVDPSALGPGAFNLAQNGESLGASAGLILSYLPKLPQLKHVIIELGLFGLSYRFGDQPQTNLGAYYHRFWGLPRDSWLEAFDPANFSLILLYGVPETKTIVARGFRNPIANVTRSGWLPMLNAPEYDERLTTRERLAREEALHQAPEALAKNSAALEQLAEALEARGVQLIGVTLPVRPAYAAAIDRPRWVARQAVVKTSLERHGFRYFDYFDDKRFGNADFFDADHLNAQGARKFSGILSQEAK